MISQILKKSCDWIQNISATVVDSITDGVNGRIVQFDPNEIANGILELLNSDVQNQYHQRLRIRMK